MKTVLSIIVPVYKVELYLNQCLDSIVSQPCKFKYEVILVDDGSPDACPQICDQWAAKYDNVHVIHQKNQGLSMARNNGLEVAQGEYVWFVDSDDWLLSTAFEDFLSAIEEYPDVDVFSSFLREFYEKENRYSAVTSHYYGMTMTGKKYMDKNLPKGASQRFIYKRAFLNDNNLRFYPDILHEDGIWGCMFLYLAHAIHVMKRPVYVYRLRSAGSIMSSLSVRSAYDLTKGHQVLIEFMNEKVVASDQKWYRSQIFMMLECSIHFCAHLLNTPEYKEFISKNRSYIKNEAAVLLKSGCFHINVICMWLGTRYLLPVQRVKRTIKYPFLRIKRLMSSLENN